MAIALFVNPRSRANRKDPELSGRLRGALGDAGRLIAPGSLEELRAEAHALHADRPGVVAVHGGDGSLHKVLSALVDAWGGEPLPPIATLCGGTMNVVASSLGLRAPPDAFLRALGAADRAGRAPTCLRRRCLRVGGRHGFVFGNGLVSNFLDEYYAPRGYGPARAVVLLVRCVLSGLWRGRLARKLFRSFGGLVTVDGTALERRVWTALCAATVREVGLGMKFNHRADDDPERMGFLGIFAGPLALALDVVAVRTGRGISPRHALSAVATSVDIQPDDGAPWGYTVDGDLYRHEGPLSITLGPAVDLVRPDLDGAPAARAS